MTAGTPVPPTAAPVPLATVPATGTVAPATVGVALPAPPVTGATDHGAALAAQALQRDREIMLSVLGVTTALQAMQPALMDPICRRVNAEAHRADFLQTWRQLQAVRASVGRLLTLVTDPVSVASETQELFNPNSVPRGRTWDEIFGRSPQSAPRTPPQKRQRPDADYMAPASGSFDKHDWAGGGDAGAGASIPHHTKPPSCTPCLGVQRVARRPHPDLERAFASGTPCLHAYRPAVLCARAQLALPVFEPVHTCTLPYVQLQHVACACMYTGDRHSIKLDVAFEFFSRSSCFKLSQPCPCLCSAAPPPHLALPPGCVPAPHRVSACVLLLCIASARPRHCLQLPKVRPALEPNPSLRSIAGAPCQRCSEHWPWHAAAEKLTLTFVLFHTVVYR